MRWSRTSCDDRAAATQLDGLLRQQVADAPHLEDLSAGGEVTELESSPRVAERGTARTDDADLRVGER